MVPALVFIARMIHLCLVLLPLSSDKDSQSRNYCLPIDKLVQHYCIVASRQDNRVFDVIIFTIIILLAVERGFLLDEGKQFLITDLMGVPVDID